MLNKLIFRILFFFSETKLGHVLITWIITVPIQFIVCLLLFSNHLSDYILPMMIATFISSCTTLMLDDSNDSPWF